MARWKKEEEEFLLNNYSTLGAKECSIKLGRSLDSIYKRASILKLSLHTKWSTESYNKSLEVRGIKAVEPYINAHTKILHIGDCSHSWESTPNNILNGSGCPTCANNYKKSHEEYATIVRDLGYEALEKYQGNKKEILHKHLKCGKVWKVRPNNILNTSPCPKCNLGPFSRKAIQWLESLNISSIKHALNGGEVKILNYKVDGYDPVTNTVYEFHGDKFHGNLDIYLKNDTCHPFNPSITAEELYNNTIQRMVEIKKQGYNIFYIWENDFNNFKSGKYF